MSGIMVWEWFEKLVAFSTRAEDGCETSSFHCRQLTSMDCGQACARMVLKWSGAQHELAIGQLSQPCWSVDIFLFLRECGLDASMYSLVRGFSPDNESLSWYQNHMTAADIDRCNSQFDIADQRGWVVQHSGQLSMKDIVARVCDPDTVAIVLVDDNLLKRRITGNYAGHYVLLVDSVGSECVYLDPATDASAKRVDVNVFDTSRIAQGTDQDIIFCSRSGSVTQGAKG